MNACLSVNASTFSDVHVHLSNVDSAFCPPLSSRVELDVYARKLVDLATRCECWNSDNLVGLVAFYECEHYLYITNFSVCADFRGTGLARKLFDAVLCLNRSRLPVMLRTGTQNVRARSFYESLGFVAHVLSCDEIDYVFSSV